MQFYESDKQTKNDKSKTFGTDKHMSDIPMVTESNQYVVDESSFFDHIIWITW